MKNPTERLSDLLTEEQVDKLPIGSVLVVTWSGGNGPHEYLLGRIGKTNYAEPTLDTPGRERLLTYNPLSFIGTERYHTHVQVKP